LINFVIVLFIFHCMSRPIAEIQSDIQTRISTNIDNAFIYNINSPISIRNCPILYDSHHQKYPFSLEFSQLYLNRTIHIRWPHQSAVYSRVLERRVTPLHPALQAVLCPGHAGLTHNRSFAVVFPRHGRLLLSSIYVSLEAFSNRPPIVWVCLLGDGDNLLLF